MSAVPTVARNYFFKRYIDSDPWVTSTFKPGTGWVEVPTRYRVSFELCRKLRKQGVTDVVLSARGRNVDFSIAELLHGSDFPLFGGSLI